ncbi:peroxisomal membrane protein 11B-like [Corticium candelabrum]|uniref:peroxisomal membrane protein 11B-like n=1 Tax=Corticium candelabrum TaxID=121492 RepID=UPI002E25931B|nr:peroxisomal membrane protein 11B-like [Corticium candelabrum]
MTDTQLDAVRRVLRFLQHTAGRDKLYRTAQYGSRLILRAWKGRPNAPQFLAILNTLESHLSLSRKLFRLFSSIDFLINALDSLKEREPVVRYLTFSAMICKAIWLLIDHILWLSKANLINFETTRWTKRSNWIWLFGILFLIVRDVYNIRVRKLTKRSNYRALVRNVCDMMLPVGNLGIVRCHDSGTAGLFGIISSLIGAYDIWLKVEAKNKIE